MMKRFIRVAILLCVVTVLLSALSLKTVEAKATPSSWKGFQNRFSSTSCGTWNVVPSPTNPNGSSGLSGVAAVSASDVWAVGGSGSQLGGGQTQIDHWNGAQWQIVQSPSPSARYNTLYGVAAVSATNVWAVGLDVNTSQVTQTLIEHWNGTHWSVVKSPSPGSGDELRAVAVVSGGDVWAAGYSINSSTIKTLVEHWNGTSWQVVKSPNVGTSPGFSGVAAVSASDVWAVGSDNTTQSMQTLTEQWNGTQWSVVKSPSPGKRGLEA